MPKDRRLFFERLTGSFSGDEEADTEVQEPEKGVIADAALAKTGVARKFSLPAPAADAEGQLLVDVHQTPDEIVVQAVVAGVKPEDLDVSITHEMVTIRGKRERH